MIYFWCLCSEIPCRSCLNERWENNVWVAIQLLEEVSIKTRQEKTSPNLQAFHNFELDRPMCGCLSLLFKSDERRNTDCPFKRCLVILTNPIQTIPICESSCLFFGRFVLGCFSQMMNLYSSKGRVYSCVECQQNSVRRVTRSCGMYKVRVK